MEEIEVSIYAISSSISTNAIKLLGQNWVPFHILPLGGYDNVLGVQWLNTLGFTKWDFDKMSMQCNVMGKEVCLHGMFSNNVEVEFELKVLKSSFVNQQGWFLQITSPQE